MLLQIILHCLAGHVLGRLDLCYMKHHASPQCQGKVGLILRLLAGDNESYRNLKAWQPHHKFSILKKNQNESKSVRLCDIQGFLWGRTLGYTPIKISYGPSETVLCAYMAH